MSTCLAKDEKAYAGLPGPWSIAAAERVWPSTFDACPPGSTSHEYVLKETYAQERGDLTLAGASQHSKCHIRVSGQK